jgi:integrase
MAHLIRPWQVRYVDKDGKRCASATPGAKKVRRRARKWYGSGIPGLPPTKRVPLASDKNVARAMLAELIKKGERGEAGLSDRAAEAALVPLTLHVNDFEAVLEARGTTAKQIRLCLTRIRHVFDACGFQLPRDIDAESVMSYLADRRRLPVEMGGIGVQTSNYYLQAVGQFCRWMVRKGKLPKNPLLDASPLNPKLDRRHDRRNLEPAELERLLEAVAASEVVYRGLTGPDRHVLYLTACGTGLRSSELALLTPASFTLAADLPIVTVPAAYNKGKRPVTQPLPPVVVAVLREYLKDRPADQPVWPGTWWERGAEMLKADLEAVGIPYAIKGPDGPLFADFHALRHTFVTLLERSGAAPKAAQSLARHTDIRLTMNRYTHADQTALAQVVGKLQLPGNDVPAVRAADSLAAGLLMILAGLCDAVFGDALAAAEEGLVARRVALDIEKTGDALGRDEKKTTKKRRRPS